jgi:hypothetical protein
MLLGFTMLAGVAVAQEASMKSEKDRASYALGMNLAKQLRAELIDVNPDALIRGLKDGVSGSRTLLSNAEARDALAGLTKRIKASRAALQQEKARLRKANAQAQTLALLVSFKMDPRLATGTYGGLTRWVSPRVFTCVGAGDSCTIDAKVEARDASGSPIAITATWTSHDPAIARVTPSEGREVQIVVRQVGETRVRVTSEGMSKELAVKATYRNKVLVVDIARQ